MGLSRTSSTNLPVRHSEPNRAVLAETVPTRFSSRSCRASPTPPTLRTLLIPASRPSAPTCDRNSIDTIRPATYSFRAAIGSPTSSIRGPLPSAPPRAPHELFSESATPQTQLQQHSPMQSIVPLEDGRHGAWHEASEDFADQGWERVNDTHEGVPAYDEPRPVPGDKRSEVQAQSDHVERWRNDQKARSPVNRLVSHDEISGLRSVSSRDTLTTQGSTRGRAGMTDAEIAQEHFRLAQQHLEAAQRLAMAAATKSPASSVPSSSYGRGPSSSTAESEYADSNWGDSTPYSTSPPDSIAGTYRSTYSHPPQSVQPHVSREDLYSEFGQLYLDKTSNSFKEGGNQTRSRTNTAGSVTSQNIALDKTGRLPASPYSDTDSRSPVMPVLAQSQQYPLPRPASSTSSQAGLRRRPSTADPVSAPKQTLRRPSTADHVDSRPYPPAPTTLPPVPHSELSHESKIPRAYETASIMAPSLYGRVLPPGMPDRIGTQPIQHSSNQKQVAVRHENERAGDVREEWNDEGDASSTISDNQDAQSMISHVTSATLPPYEHIRRQSIAAVPSVPSIPAAFLQSPALATHTTSTLGSRSHNASAPSRERLRSVTQVGSISEEGEFHGFRPRNAGTPSFPPQEHLWPASGRQPILPQQYPFSSAAMSPPLQPQSYIIGADGRPIPVYASLAAPLPAASPARQVSPSMGSTIRQALPIHSQPLQFDHSLYLSPSTISSSSRSPVSPSTFSTTISSPPPPPPPPPALGTRHAYHLPPPSTFVQPSLTSISQPSFEVRPPSATSSTSSEHSYAPSIANSTFPFLNKTRRNVLASSSMSLRKMVRSPHVRFKSPEPLREVGPPQAGGSIQRREETVQEGEQRMEKNEKAMAQSLGMLM
ncbi:uncharacterized protein JCM15063_002485 [Sporobolomyces koalae]|uniref:uncharacterized protein n=1 Tax=Sporobolomyces koalae TaxID=500713 RepID=UPI003174176A